MVFYFQLKQTVTKGKGRELQWSMLKIKQEWKVLAWQMAINSIFYCHYIISHVRKSEKSDSSVHDLTLVYLLVFRNHCIPKFTFEFFKIILVFEIKPDLWKLLWQNSKLIELFSIITVFMYSLRHLYIWIHVLLNVISRHFCFRISFS